MRAQDVDRNAHHQTLVVDLDGTLIKTDVLVEGVLSVLKRNALLAFALPFWLLRGKAGFKEEIARRAVIDPALLPFNEHVLSLLASRAQEGQRLVLATAANQKMAATVAGHLGNFDAVLASTSDVNLSGDRKLSAVRDEVGVQGFSYVGNGKPDLPLWSAAQEVIVVDPERGVLSALHRAAKAPSCVIRSKKAYAGSFFRALRPHQWLKNGLLFVPLLAAHQWGNGKAWASAALLLVAFSITASSIYLLNDLLDLDSDRRHPRKRLRPIPTGDLPLLHALVLSPLLMILGISAAFLLSAKAGWLVAAYALVSTAYSAHLKQYVVLDVIVLAALYTSRLLAGAAAVGVELSFWLLAFSMFLFLSLAIVKRITELKTLAASGKASASGRGYEVADLRVVQALGIASGYISVLVFALYINAPEVKVLYPTHQALWAVCVALIYWIGRLWVKAERGEMHDDPLVWAITDRNSVALGLGVVAALIVATLP